MASVTPSSNSMKIAFTSYLARLSTSSVQSALAPRLRGTFVWPSTILLRPRNARRNQAVTMKKTKSQARATKSRTMSNFWLLDSNLDFIPQTFPHILRLPFSKSFNYSIISHLKLEPNALQFTSHPKTVSDFYGFILVIRQKLSQQIVPGVFFFLYFCWFLFVDFNCCAKPNKFCRPLIE